MSTRARLLTIGLAAAMLTGLLMSARLWLSSRSFPLAPAFAFLPTVPPPIDRLWFVALLFSLFSVIITALARPQWRRVPIMAFVALAGLLALWDQTRWQPWFYQYLFMLAALGLAPDEEGEDEATEPGLNACRLIVASIYFWSGLQKCNYAFIHETYGDFIKDILGYFPESMHAALDMGKYAAPFVEAGIGVGLLVRPARNVAIVLAILLHVFILFALGPLGSNFNSIVWPWNLAMVFFVLVLFAGSQAAALDVVWPRSFLFARATLLLFGIMPALGFFGWWDSYLSASLYSGNTADAELYSNVPLDEAVPEKHLIYRLDEEGEPTGVCQVDLYSWCMEELNVPPNPEPRVFRLIATRLAEKERPPGRLLLVHRGRPNWWTGKIEEQEEFIDAPPD
jgi:hypothetical protein